MSHKSMERGTYISSLAVAFHGHAYAQLTELQYCTLLIHEVTFVFRISTISHLCIDINTWSWSSKVCVISVLTVSVLSVLQCRLTVEFFLLHANFRVPLNSVRYCF